MVAVKSGNYVTLPLLFHVCYALSSVHSRVRRASLQPRAVSFRSTCVPSDPYRWRPSPWPRHILSSRLHCAGRCRRAQRLTISGEEERASYEEGEIKLTIESACAAFVAAGARVPSRTEVERERGIKLLLRASECRYLVSVEVLEQCCRLALVAWQLTLHGHKLRPRSVPVRAPSGQANELANPTAATRREADSPNFPGEGQSEAPRRQSYAGAKLKTNGACKAEIPRTQSSKRASAPAECPPWAPLIDARGLLAGRRTRHLLQVSVSACLRAARRPRRASDD